MWLVPLVVPVNLVVVHSLVSSNVFLCLRGRGPLCVFIASLPVHAIFGKGQSKSCYLWVATTGPSANYILCESFKCTRSFLWSHHLPWLEIIIITHDHLRYLQPRSTILWFLSSSVQLLFFTCSLKRFAERRLFASLTTSTMQDVGLSWATFSSTLF